MAALSTIGLIGGLALSAAGTGIQYSAGQQAAAAQRRATLAQQQEQEARKVQMNLEASRQKRNIIRQGIIAQSNATATATSQGAQFGSTLPGAISAIQGTTGSNYQGVNDAQATGNSMFSSAQSLLNARQDQSDAQSFGAIGTGLSSLGGQLTKNLGPINSLSKSIFD